MDLDKIIISEIAQTQKDKHCMFCLLKFLAPHLQMFSITWSKHNNQQSKMGSWDQGSIREVSVRIQVI